MKTNYDMPSYERINYLLRPNKSVERKMVCEMLSGISMLKSINSYQYIGFGSTYFADFSLFHRLLGITKMISLEKDDDAKDRCEFNKPFGCIELKMGESTGILPNLGIDTLDSIVWLDYDDCISDTVFSDINSVIGLMKPDSFFMLSINADIAKLKSLRVDNEDLVQTAIGLVGEERYPNLYLEINMSQKNYLSVLYQCITQEIKAAIQKRNGMEKHKVLFHQSVFFVYGDGAKILTLGGFLFREDEEMDHLDKMGICKMPFYRHEEEAYSIQCPILSIREIQALNAHLPCKEMGHHGVFEDSYLNDFPIDNSDINHYASLYRYFPNFAETLL